MSDLEKLKSTKNLSEFAHLLGYKPKSLSFIIYKIPDDNKYTEFTIPKKNGGVRKIKKPVDRLKRLQKRLAGHLSKCFEEIHSNIPITKKQDKLSHGFRKKRSIITNAQRHRGRRHVFNADLSDFFPSINFGRVRGYFISNNHFKLDPSIATIIAQIACHDHQLPQGSPCSPVISNMIGHMLDIRMSALANKAKCIYTRYADDLTFSTNLIEFPSLIAKNVGGCNEWASGKSLRKEVRRSGFEINEKKTSLQHKTSRQVVTGLVVNKKVNIKSEYYRTARSMCHELFNKGQFYFVNTTTSKDNSTSKVDSQNVESGSVGPSSNKKTIGSLAQLEGKLSYIYQVKRSHDKQPTQEKKKPTSSIMRLYSKLLFYKHFFALDCPLIICEGKTDIVYLKCALRQLMSEFSALIEKKDNKYMFKIKFLNFSKYFKEVLSISDGTSGLVKILNFYPEYIKLYKGSGKNHPVIMLVDNDKGSVEIKKILTNKYGYDPAIPYCHVVENLYVVHTPLINGEEAAIEDLFDEVTLSIQVKGKTFNKNKEIDTENNYGKSVFAKEVVIPNQKKINFDKFKVVFQSFVLIINDYKAQKAPTSSN